MVLCTECEMCVMKYGSKTVIAWCRATDDLLSPDKIYDDSECDLYVNLGRDLS